jgi:hypothetical protein
VTIAVEDLDCQESHCVARLLRGPEGLVFEEIGR